MLVSVVCNIILKADQTVEGPIKNHKFIVLFSISERKYLPTGILDVYRHGIHINGSLTKSIYSLYFEIIKEHLALCSDN